MPTKMEHATNLKYQAARTARHAITIPPRLKKMDLVLRKMNAVFVVVMEFQKVPVIAQAIRWMRSAYAVEPVWPMTTTTEYAIQKMYWAVWMLRRATTTPSPQ